MRTFSNGPNMQITQAFANRPKVRVLFIGNSLTYVNDLPGMVSQLAKSGNFIMEYDMYAPGGYRLVQHASDPAALQKISGSKWDFVVLQEQSQWPAFSDDQVRREVFPYARSLCDAVRAANPASQVVFYDTMARMNGDPGNIAVSPDMATYDGMQKRIDNSYSTMARDNNALLAPVGQAWNEVRTYRSSINLYADETHPNLTGTYLAACVFYNVIFKKSPVGLWHPSEIDDDTASYLQSAAERAAAASVQP